MPQQQEPTSAAPTTPSPESRVQPPPPPPMHPANTLPSQPQRIPNWLQQAERLLRVVVRIYVGLIITVVPWILPAFWDNNPLFSGSPALQTFITSGVVRGLVSGLGLLNLWIALRDALRPANTTPPR